MTDPSVRPDDPSAIESVDDVPVGRALLQRLREGLRTSLDRQRSHAPAIGFDLQPDLFAVVLRAAGEEGR